MIMAYNSVTPRNLQYTLDNIAQNNWFRYKEDDNVMGNYDGNIQVDDATIEYERNAITLPFSACSTKGGVAYIPLYSYNEEGELEGSLKTVAQGLDEDDNPVIMVVRFR